MNKLQLQPMNHKYRKTKNQNVKTRKIENKENNEKENKKEIKKKQELLPIKSPFVYVIYFNISFFFPFPLLKIYYSFKTDHCITANATTKKAAQL